MASRILTSIVNGLLRFLDALASFLLNRQSVVDLRVDTMAKPMGVELWVESGSDWSSYWIPVSKLGDSARQMRVAQKREDYGPATITFYLVDGVLQEILIPRWAVFEVASLLASALQEALRLDAEANEQPPLGIGA